MFRKVTVVIAAAALALGGVSACGKKEDSGSGSGSGSGDDKQITLGFSQVGSESGWRSANTISIKEAATEAGIKLQFSDAQQQQQNQIQAIRNYIQQKVDVIAFSPVVESGWDPVLNEAKTAGIPVVLTDRAIDSKDESLYVSFLGSDFKEEGVKAGKWVVEHFKDAKEVKWAQLEGTLGSAPANDRKAGFTEALGGDAKFKLLASQTGEFTRAKGKEVFTAMLKAHPDIQLLFAHNDDMGLGAIEAIKAAGKVPGKDIIIVTIDAVKAGMEALAAGEINYIVECSPLLGPQLMDIVKKVKAGESVQKRIVTQETEFDQAKAKAELPNRKY